MTDAPCLVLNDVPTPLYGVAAATTLLDWLRTQKKLTGTKEGCAEGDCGACTVVVERLAADGSIRREVANACLTMVGQLDGAGVRTVEGLSSADGALHPVQAALAGNGSTQCGFCTPGFVMSAYAFAAGGEPGDTALIHDALAGNLCRCTGYRPIVEAVAEVAQLETDPLEPRTPALAAALRTAGESNAVAFEHDGQRFFAPRALADAAALRAAHPNARLLAGGTDLGLLVSQKRQRISEIIYLGRVRELTLIDDASDRVVIGAAVTYTDALASLTALYPDVRTYITRLGSRQIRNMGTIGGNIGTASPIGDSLPLLLAMDARIRVISAARGRREIAADEFFTGYRQTALAGDEIIEAVVIPKPPAGAVLYCDKISKRRDQDISTVCAAYRLRLDSGTVREARIAFGGVADRPKRCRAAEEALIGRRLDEPAAAAAGAALDRDIQPLSDWRGSAEYRRQVARNLLRRLALRLAGGTAPMELDSL